MAAGGFYGENSGRFVHRRSLAVSRRCRKEAAGKCIEEKYFAIVAESAPESACYMVKIVSHAHKEMEPSMKRCSRSITLVLLSSAVFLAGCEDRPAAPPVEQVNASPDAGGVLPEFAGPVEPVIGSPPATTQAGT